MSVKDELMRLVDHVDYWQPEGATVMVCCLVFKNGITELGWASCMDPKNFDEKKGREFALESAVEKSLCYLAWAKAEQTHKDKENRQWN